MDNLVGLKFNKLTVIKRSHKQRKVWLWECLCDCGKITFTSGSHLKNNHTKSCGCIAKRLEQGRTSKNRIFRSYRRHAKDRNLDFSLTFEQFEKIILKNCFYCGVRPLNCSKEESGDYIVYNGIDRVLNDFGYDENNVVPCCKNCNMMKKNLPADTFITHCRRVTNFINKSIFK